MFEIAVSEMVESSRKFKVVSMLMWFNLMQTECLDLGHVVLASADEVAHAINLRCLVRTCQNHVALVEFLS